VVRDFLDAAGPDPAAAKHVFEKRTDVGRRLRSAKSDDQHRVEGLWHVPAAIILIRFLALL
jgi:hypothetical protein